MAAKVIIKSVPDMLNVLGPELKSFRDALTEAWEESAPAREKADREAREFVAWIEYIEKDRVMWRRRAKKAEKELGQLRKSHA